MAEIVLPKTLAEYKPSGRMCNGVYVFFGIDSDGCVDKGMRYKHGGPFPRAGIEAFDLQPIAEPWRIAWSYVNEIEKRGCPRFEALATSVDRVLEMPVVQEAEARGIVKVPRLEHLKKYNSEVASKKGWGDNVLQEHLGSIESISDKLAEYNELQKVASWSKLVSHYVDTDCPYIEPFAPAVTAIKLAHDKCIDQIIISGTPETHLRRTWEQHGLIGYIRGVFGRESGKKNDHLVGAMQAAQRDLGRMYDIAIMFGDAPEDNKSRKKAIEELKTEIRFMPIRVGYEVEDWQWFIDNFLKPEKVSDYDANVEAERIRMFEENLRRPWNPNVDITRLFPQP